MHQVNCLQTHVIVASVIDSRFVRFLTIQQNLVKLMCTYEICKLGLDKLAQIWQLWVKCGTNTQVFYSYQHNNLTLKFSAVQMINLWW